MKKITPEISELAGLFAADGSMQRKHLCFWGNISEDKDYYDDVINNLFKTAFGFNIKLHEKRSNSVYGFYVCKKSVINFFNEILGFPFGKKTHNVKVPDIIMDSNELLIWSSFIRGFCNGDGSLNFNKRYGNYKKRLKIFHTYPRIQIKSASHKIIDDISILLNRLGINHFTCIIKNKNGTNDYKLLQVSGKKRLEQWIDKIGFNNPVYKTKYMIFKKYGFVPRKTTLLQRKEILRGVINPFIFYEKVL